LYYEYQFPEKIFRYEDPKERLFDMIIGFSSVLIGISALFYVYTNEYTKTNSELSEKNKQLEDHNEELEQHKNEIEKQRRILEAQKYHINESLNYAKKIQTAVLSSYATLKKNVADSFLFYLPKEKISGDFYFFSKKGNRLIVVIADSTGHGVPGGFMSMLGITILDEIVNNEKFNDAGTALNLFREKIISSLDRESSKNISGDGFDVAFCMIDTKLMTLNYAGANIPLLLIRDKTIVTFEPDDMPVGKFIEMKTFQNHFTDIQKNDILYLFTDGITDQFGGDKMTKFSMEKLKQILVDYSGDPLTVQKEKFKKIFRDWKGGNKRTDDALILGFKVK
jgi:serine phosphatase RsbU (regulator of sigma subunit)